MKTAILSDIHSNLNALEAVLQDIENQGGAAQYWCLGDIVDYGPLPHECLEIMRRLKAVTIIGNHDLAVVGSLNSDQFVPSIEVVTRWTKTRLSREELSYLKGLPLTLTVGDFTLVHGSPRDPIWEYIISAAEARENLDHLKTRYCLVGHTHVPLCFQFAENSRLPAQSESSREYRPVSQAGWDRLIHANRCGESTIQLNRDYFIINPGSVGQPRDNDPRAAYAIYDSVKNALELRRVEYDIAATRKTMQEFGLPEWFSERLVDGV